MYNKYYLLASTQIVFTAIIIHINKKYFLFCDETWKENIDCMLSVKLSAPQIFLFIGQAWKHGSTQIVVTAINKCLSKNTFLSHGLAWKCFVVYIISHKFCLTVRLENIIQWILSVTVVYTCCTSIIHLSENIFCFMTWLENILQFVLLGKQVWQSGLKTQFCGDYWPQQFFT